ncbi:MAG: type I-C CRISPR-associated protein Cas8c/Csd1 [Beijerinckiaceae bacterium]
MSLLAALVRRYERMAAHGAAPPLGYSDEYLHFKIVIDDSGEIQSVMDLREASGKRAAKARRFRVPQAPSDRRGRKIVPGLFWDPAGYALGLAAGTTEKDLDDASRKFAAFKKKHLELLSNATSRELAAFKKFLVGWDVQKIAGNVNLPDMRKSQIGFQLDGLRQHFIHECAEAAGLISRESASPTLSEGMCLVTGEISPIERLHPPIAGFPDADKIVSFNETAFESYGKAQGANAPVSVKAAFAYTSALSGLLTSASHRVQIGDASVVFWAEPGEGEEEGAKASEDFMALLFGGGNSDAEPAPDDKGTEADLLSKLSSVAKGQPVPGLSINGAMPFYVLGLSPNAARISVRFWHETTLGDLSRKLMQHFEDLRLEPLPWKKPPGFWRLLVELAAQRKSENIPAHLAGEVTRAILTGGPYPMSLLTLAITRLRADHDVNGHRAAIIKAVLTRLKKEVPVSLSREEPDPGYRLGRLFAVLEAVQRAGVGDVNAGIRDRYIGAASANPSRVFPILLRGAQDHLSSARKKGKVGYAVNLEKEISEIMGGLSAAAPFPPTLNLDGQGRFFVGFYHQQASLFTKRTPDADSDNNQEK